jgi:hypothetical protein
MTHHEKIKLEAILESAFPRMDQNFCDAYNKLLPGFNGFIVIMDAKTVNDLNCELKELIKDGHFKYF